MAGSVDIDYGTRLPVQSVSLRWTSDADGNVSGARTARLNGTLVRVVFKPDGAPTQPTNAYDVTLLDERGVDLLAGEGGDLANNATTQLAPALPHTDGTTTHLAAPAVDDELELVIANAGNARRGTITLYLR